MMIKQLTTAIKMLLLMVLILGIIYPLFVTGIAQIFFPFQANGSLLKEGDKVFGSKLIAQYTEQNIYFSSRPLVDKGVFTPSNLALTSLSLHNKVNDRRQDFIKKNNLEIKTQLPSDVLFTSASGLDPHISPEAAELQVARIVKVREFDDVQVSKLKAVIEALTERPQFNLLGCSRINVLMLNLELDKIK